MIKNWKNWLNETTNVKTQSTILTLCPNTVNTVQTWYKSNPSIESLVLEFATDCTNESCLKDINLITTYHEMALDYPELISLAEMIKNKYGLEIDAVKNSLTSLNESIENKNWYKPELKREIEKQDQQNRDTIIGFVVVLILFILSLFFNDASIGIF